MSWQPSVAAAPGPLGPTGATGAAGSSVRHGNGVPSSDLGANGDYYIDETDPSAPVFYGPKAAGAWGAGVSLGGSLPGGDVTWGPDNLEIDAQDSDIELVAPGELGLQGVQVAIRTGLLGFFGTAPTTRKSVPNDGSATPAQVAAALVSSTLMAAS